MGVHMGNEPKSLVLWVLVSKEAESQKITLLGSRAVRGLVRMQWKEELEQESQGSLCSGRDSSPEAWRLDLPGEPQSEGCFRRGSSGDSEMWEGDWARLAGPLTACTLGKNQALGINSHEEELPHIQCQIFGHSNLWVLRKKQPQRAAGMCGSHSFLWPDLDIQGDPQGEAQEKGLGLAAPGQS